MGHAFAVAEHSGEGEGRDQDEHAAGPLAWLGARAYLTILVALALIIGWRLVSSWLEWLLIAVAVGAVIYLIKRRPDDEPRSD